MSTYGERTLATPILASTSTSELVSISLVTPCLSTLAIFLGMMLVSHEFLQYLVDSQTITNTWLQNIKVEVVTLYGKI